MSTTITPTPRLTRDAIIDAADEIVRNDGAEALSMRRLADHLGVSTMAAYRHVTGGRPELGRLLLERVFAKALEANAADAADVAANLFLLFGTYRGLEREISSFETAPRNIALWLDGIGQHVTTDGADAVLWLIRGALADGGSVGRVRRVRRAVVAIERSYAPAGSPA